MDIADQKRNPIPCPPFSALAIPGGGADVDRPRVPAKLMIDPMETGMFGNSKFYDLVSRMSYDAAVAFLQGRRVNASPLMTNMVCMMVLYLAATADALEALQATMPQSLAGVNKNILTLDVLAHTTTSLQQAITYRHKKEHGNDAIARVWLGSTSVAKTLKDHWVSQYLPGHEEFFLERWKEFRAIEDLHERFGFLTYMLFTSKGHKKPLGRYPGSPPVLLDLALGIESMGAELAYLEALAHAVDEIIRVGALMPPDDDDL